MDSADKSAYPMRGHNYDNPDGGFYHVQQRAGLTKRERFAMAAMQGLLSHSKNVIGMEGLAKKNGISVNEVLAKVSVEVAGALLNELENN